MQVLLLLSAQEAKKERERQRELLRQDYRDRFGCEVCSGVFVAFASAKADCTHSGCNGFFTAVERCRCFVEEGKCYD